MIIKTLVLRSAIVLSAFALFISHHSLAHNSAPDLEELVVTASRIEMPSRQVGASVSVLTADDLEHKNFPSLGGALRSLPSVDVRQSGGEGNATGVRIRGEEAHRTLLLIDGLNVTDVTAVQPLPRFEHVMSSQIGRVEVLRGPQGMMYGADAGGVVSVFAKQSDQLVEGDLGAETGRYDSHRLDGNLRGKVGRLNYSMTASNFFTAGFNSMTDDDVIEDDDGYKNTTLHGTTTLALTENSGVGLVLREVNSTSQYDGCWSPREDCLSIFEQQSGKFDWHYSDERQSHEVAYTHSTTDQVDRFGDPDLDEEINPVSFDVEGQLEQWQYFGTYRFADELSFVFGMDHRVDQVIDRQPFQSSEESSQQKEQRDQVGVFAESQVSFEDRFFYTIGIRYDDNEDFGQHTSYRFTAAYLVPVGTSELKFRTSYGTGFRAPSLFELAFNRGAAVSYPVPTQLSEETSEGSELGVEWKFSPTTLVELVWFDNRIENEIAFGDHGYMQSTGETRSTGVDLVASIEPLSNLIISGNYTYNDTALAHSGDQRIRRPKHLYNASLAYSFWQNRINWSAFYRNARDIVDYAGGGRVALDNHQVLDMTGSWSVSEELDLYLRWENVLDTDYQQVAGYYTSGSAGYIGFRVKLL